ncbi:hypothetical protein [Myxococcus stipitatus]|uniref:hypothetical protein n=1 Tax=Myxococcus stipitatus TaxID=83455 RepID=UPI00030941D1|nr:hypothetical protein [Myxococcus stipitatus]
MLSRMRPKPHLSAVPPPPLDDATPPEPTSLASPWWKDLVRVFLLGGAMAAVVGWLASERRAVLSLEPEARAAAFQEEWAGFQRLCAGPTHQGFVPRCREQARFLLNFPECQGDCQELARLHGRALR